MIRFISDDFLNFENLKSKTNFIQFKSWNVKSHMTKSSWVKFIQDQVKIGSSHARLGQKKSKTRQVGLTPRQSQVMLD